jgi:hypothetical protein
MKNAWTGKIRSKRPKKKLADTETITIRVLAGRRVE